MSRIPRVGLMLAAAVCLLQFAGCLRKGDPDVGLRAGLEANRARWAAASITSYEFRYRKSCFCPTDAGREVVLTVSGGSVVSGRYVDDGTVVAASQLADYPTVEGLFEIIQTAIEENADSIVAEYHPDLGYPTRVAIDPIVAATDDEVTHVASSLVIQP